MDKEINNEVTLVSLDKMIYHAIHEIRYRLSKRPDEKRIFSFVKEFLDGGNLSFCRKAIRMPVIIRVIYPRQSIP